MAAVFRLAFGNTNYLKCVILARLAPSSAVLSSRRHISDVQLYLSLLDEKRPKESREKVPNGAQYKDRKFASDLTSLKTKGFLRSTKAYAPPADVKERIIEMYLELTGGKEVSTKLETVALSDDLLCFNLFVKCIKTFDHKIPNSQLHKIKTLADLIEFYQMEVKSSTAFDDLKNRSDLPPNLYIQKDYIRFNPETDTHFGGVSAFPGRPNIVTGLKTKKLYKGFKSHKYPYKV